MGAKERGGGWREEEEEERMVRAQVQLRPGVDNVYDAMIRQTSARGQQQTPQEHASDIPRTRFATSTGLKTSSTSCKSSSCECYGNSTKLGPARRF